MNAFSKCFLFLLCLPLFSTLTTATNALKHRTISIQNSSEESKDVQTQSASIDEDLDIVGRDEEDDELLTHLNHYSNKNLYKNKEDKFGDDSSYSDRSDQVDESISYPDKVSNNEDALKFKSAEYEEKPLTSSLDEFGSGKLGVTETGTSLPVFLTEPESTFVVKNRPAILKCKAAHALQLQFKCSGSSHPPPSNHDKHVDPHSGVHLEEVTATINRDLVDEYFGKTPFKCECHAWSSRGVAKSQAATINVAYIRKQFTASPTSLRVELGAHAEMHCQPPTGNPTPKISWYRNDVPIIEEHGITLSTEGVLSINQVSLTDMANYTCSAENIAGKKTSDSAVLIVYVNGGWSNWSPWTECKCFGKQSQGRKRTRICNNPIAMNGGLQCSGPQIQKSPDCISCPEDTQIVNPDSMDISFGRWSSWSEWSSCSSECIQIRRRKCITHAADDILISGNGVAFNDAHNKLLCSGKDFQTAECRGEHCHVGKRDFDWALYLGLAFIIAICFAFGVALLCCVRRGIGENPHYSIARSVMGTDYMHTVDKKAIRMHIEAGNVNYDYANPSDCADERIINCAMLEHHYDVPNLSANYTNPIDDLGADYLSDTADTSTCTSDSTYDITSKLPTLSVSKKSLCKLSIAREAFSSNGGCLRLYDGQLMLYVPDMTMGKNQKKHISVAILSDDSSRISIPTTESLLIVSVIVYCAPIDYIFAKPIILKIPHCLVDPSLWYVSLYLSSNHVDDLNISWEKIITIGEEKIGATMLLHLDNTHAYIMTEQLGRFVILAEAKAGVDNSSINMKLIAFSQLSPNCINCSLRIYIVKNLPNSKDICSRIESQLGGTYMGESAPFSFYLNSCDLNIRVSFLDGWDPINDLQEQIIPYNHILSNNSILHCEFSLKRTEIFYKNMNLKIEFSQTRSEDEIYTFNVPHQASQESKGLPCEERRIISIDKQGNYVNEISANIQIKKATKKMICTSLDILRDDGQDWRLLAKKLEADKYISYFASKPSPTEQILNLWECKFSSTNTIIELIIALKDMNRDDVIQIIEQTIGPLWI